MIQAIETEYNGYRFRSRLEARWAVFFDVLGIRYEYEPQGFELPEQWYWSYPRNSDSERLYFAPRHYLPDFWLPDLEYWVEIKGPQPTIEELIRVGQLAHLTGYHSFVFHSTIGDDDPEFGYEIQPIHWWWPARDNKQSSIDCNEHYVGMNWGEDEQTGAIDICCAGASIKAVMADDYSHYAYHVTDQIIRAFNVARSARFEHGETPQVIERVVYKTIEQSPVIWRDIDIIVRDYGPCTDFTKPASMIFPMKGIHLNDGGVPLCAPLDARNNGGFNLGKWKPRRADVLVSNICKRCINYSLARAKRGRQNA